MARMSREVREARAIMVAQQNLEARLAKIGWEEEVLYPALDRVLDGTLSIVLNDGAVEQREIGSGDAV
jgi:hypothetical protein